LCGVTVAETLLVYAVAPLVLVAIMAALTLRPDPKARRRRYRAGQPWEHEPLWYAPHGTTADAGHGADTAGAHGTTQAIGSSVYGEPSAGDGRVAPHGTTQGATAVSSDAPLAGRGGPLGGARGTW
jgi:hypothetical protein